MSPMVTTHRVIFLFCFLILCAVLVMPRVGQSAEKDYMNSISNEAYERLIKSDVKYRFSIDMASLKIE